MRYFHCYDGLICRMECCFYHRIKASCPDGQKNASHVCHNLQFGTLNALGVTHVICSSSNALIHMYMSLTLVSDLIYFAENRKNRDKCCSWYSNPVVPGITMFGIIWISYFSEWGGMFTEFLLKARSFPPLQLFHFLHMENDRRRVHHLSMPADPIMAIIGIPVLP